MKILIGGGAGYLGTELCKELIRLNYDITVIDLFWFGNNLPKNVKIINKNLFDCNIDDFRGFEQFIFLAGLSNDPMADFSPKLNYIYNAALPSYLAYIAKKANVKRYIYASSCSIYGYTDNKKIDENGYKSSTFPYGISKYQGEIGISNLSDDNFSTICLRMGTIGGYSDKMRFDVVLNAMYKSAMTNNKIVVNNPIIKRPILDIRDAVQSYIKSIKCDYSISDEFNICSENTTIKDLGLRIKQKVEEVTKKNIDIEILNIEDKRTYIVDIDKSSRILNYIPKYTIEDTISSLYKNFNDDFDNPLYINIKTFKNLNIE